MGKWYGKESFRWLVLISCIAVYCTSTLVRWNYTSITKYLSADLGIGKPELGLLGSAFFWSYALAQAPAGSLADMFGGRRIIPVGTGLMGAFLIGFALSTTFTETLVWRVAMGIVASACWVPITAVIMKWFSSKERGFAMEMITGVGGGVGEAISFMLVPFIAVLVTKISFFDGLPGWRSSTILMGIIVIIVAISSHFMIRSSPADMGLPELLDVSKKKKEKYSANVKEILTDPSFWFLSFVWCGYIISSRLIVGWVSVYGAEYYMNAEGMKKEMAMIAGGTIATTFTIGRAVCAPVVGKLSDYLRKHYGVPRSLVLLIGLLLLILTFITFRTVVPTVMWLGVLAFFGGAFINIYALVNVVAAELWSPSTAGFSTGLINTVAQFAGAASLSISGFMAVKFATKGGAYYTGFYGIWYMGIVICTLASLAGVYVVYRERKVLKALSVEHR